MPAQRHEPDATATSWLHRAHPSLKLVLLVVAIPTLPLVLQHWESLVVMGASLAAVLISARITWRQCAYFTPAVGMLVFAAVSWLVTGSGGSTLVVIGAWGFRVTVQQGGVEQAVPATLRALVWLLSYMLLLTTTSSRDLVAGLQRLHVPDRISQAVGLTFRYWSTVMVDASRVADAQRLRGVNLDSGAALVRPGRQFAAVALPTLFIMLRRFRSLDFALVLRCAGARERRTPMRLAPPRAVDALGGAVAVAGLVVLGTYDWIGAGLAW